MKSYCSVDTEIQFCKDKRVLEIDDGDGLTIWMYLIPLNYTLKTVKIVNFVTCILTQWKNWGKNEHVKVVNLRLYNFPILGGKKTAIMKSPKVKLSEWILSEKHME